MISAMNWSGLYAGLEMGADISRFPGSISIAPTPAGALPALTAIPGSSINLATTTGLSFAGGGQVGYNWQFPNNWVFGGEVDFKGDARESAVTTSLFTVPVGISNFVAGDTFRASSAWNGSARVRLGYAWGPVLPYITGGVAFADISLRTNFIPVGTLFPASAASASDTLIGWTVGGGFEYALNPSWSLGAEYRYADYGSTTLALGTLVTAASPTASVSEPVRGKVGLDQHSVMVKLNYHFGASPPAPAPIAAPVPPPAAPKVFIVFFDWDKDTVTPEGHAVIMQAADAYKAGAPVQIQVTGYTDRSGSPGYNQRLSERRANNVAKALAALGVPKTQMLVGGRGENDNRVPTADGVREPQNRRVEIVAP